MKKIIKFLPLLLIPAALSCAKQKSSFFEDKGSDIDNGLEKIGDDIDESLDKADQEMQKGFDKTKEKVNDVLK